MGVQTDINQKNRSESPEIESRIYDHLIFYKDAKPIQWRQTNLSSPTSRARTRTTGYPYGEKMNFAPYSHAKGKH